MRLRRLHFGAVAAIVAVLGLGIALLVIASPWAESSSDSAANTGTQDGVKPGDCPYVADYEGTSARDARGDDIDDDGYSDFVVGAPTWNSGEGRAYVFFGSGAGPTAGPILTDAGALSEAFGSSFGSGDFNGDGYADFVVGEPNCCAGAIGSEGRISVYAGGVSGPTFVLSIDPTNLSTTWFGRSVAGVGDVDREKHFAGRDDEKAKPEREWNAPAAGGRRYDGSVVHS